MAARDDEAERLEVAVRALKGPNDSLTIGAMKLLGRGIYRKIGGDHKRICVPSELLKGAQEAVTQHALFKFRLEDYQLGLASQFEAPSPYVVEAVALSAFAEHPQISDLLNDDIRPVARSVLAGFGERAAAYSEIAFEQMSSQDALGTGAAQIAAATGHPESLQRIQQLMDAMLRKLSESQAVPWHTKHRLYELAYALALAGSKSRPFIAPLEKLMAREVESHALQFGMVSLPPKQMCEIIDRIEPGMSSKYDYCSNPKYSIDH